MDGHYWAFVGAAIVLIVLPGPDMVLLVRNGAVGGRRVAAATGLGICTGLLGHATAAALGLSALLAASATAFTVVKLLGAAYLVWLGIRSLRSAWRGEGHPEGVRRAVRAGQGFRYGLLSNVLNPKVAVFFVTLLPQFVDPSGSVLAQTLLLAATHWVLSLVWLLAVSCVVGLAASMLSRARVRRWVAAVAGGVLVGLGARLAVAAR